MANEYEIGKEMQEIKTRLNIIEQVLFKEPEEEKAKKKVVEG